MIKVLACYLLSLVSLAHAGEKFEVESNGCIISAAAAGRFSSFKTDEGVSFLKYEYKDGREENVKLSCKGMSLADAISSAYVKEKDGLKVAVGSQPFAEARSYSGSNWSGVEGVYFLDAVCFTTSFEAGREHIFFVDACGEEKDIKELRENLLGLLKRATTTYSNVLSE